IVWGANSSLARSHGNCVVASTSAGERRQSARSQNGGKVRPRSHEGRIVGDGALDSRRRTGHLLQGGREHHAAEERQARPDRPARSEEHTSELQSLAYLVCRLLLEKNKK